MRNGYVKINPKRMRATAGVAAVVALVAAAPAYALDEAGAIIVQQTKEATKVAQKVLVTAAVLALIIGLAPMLWGQVKVKWIISSLVACVLFGLAGTVVEAFAA